MVDPEVRIFFSNFPLKSVYTSYAPSMMSQGKTPWKDPVLGVFPASVGAINLERPPQINVNLQFLRGLNRSWKDPRVFPRGFSLGHQ